MIQTRLNSLLTNKFFYPLFLLLSCYACSTGKNFIQSDNCDFMKETAKPAWIDGSRDIPGYYIGVGQSEKNKDGVDNQLLKAKENAMADLAKTIRVQVKSDINIFTAVHKVGRKERVTRQSISDIKTTTDLELSDAVQDSAWLDQDNCIYWVRVKVRRVLVDNLILLNQAESLYQSAKNQSTGLSARLQHINESIHVLKKVSFKALPPHYGDQGIYLSRYLNLQKDLKSQTQGRRLVYIVNGSEELPDSFLSSLAVQFMARHPDQPAWHEKDADCTIDKICLNIARNSQAKWLVLIQANAGSSAADMGMWEGELEIQAALYDVRKGQLVSGKVTAKDKTFSFDKNNMAWQEVVNKLFARNAFDSFFKILKHHLSTHRETR